VLAHELHLYPELTARCEPRVFAQLHGRTTSGARRPRWSRRVGDRGEDRWLLPRGMAAAGARALPAAPAKARADEFSPASTTARCASSPTAGSGLR
jgi:hypothetical protein